MISFVTPDEMRAAEMAAVAAGVPEPQLMRDASEAMAAWIDQHVEHPLAGEPSALGLVGPRNNGGDCLCVLALLAERGWRCSAVLLDRDGFGDLPVDPASLAMIEIVSPEQLPDTSVILDGVYGIGGHGWLSNSVNECFRRVRVLRQRTLVPIVAIDVPSGVDALTGAAPAGGLPADVTLCLGFPKIGLINEPAASRVGELVLLPFGITQPNSGTFPRFIDADSVRDLLPRRAASIHKHDAGTVLIVGGAENYYGAPRLSAGAALRVGAGLVAVAAPEHIIPTIAAQVPEAVLIPLPPQSDDRLQTIQSWIHGRGGRVDAIVVGPGMGTTDAARTLLFYLLQSEGSPVAGLFRGGVMPRIVIDADALNWLSSGGELGEWLPDGAAVLTPHAGELARLMQDAGDISQLDSLIAATNAAERYRHSVIFKRGFSVLATHAGETWIAPRATPELATPGTGDVLAGIIGGLAAQGLSTTEAARMAMWVGSQAGKECRQRTGTRGVLATDVIAALPNALNGLERQTRLTY